MAPHSPVFKVGCLLFVSAVLALAENRRALAAEPPAKAAPKELAKIPPYKRMLQGEDAKRVAELEEKVKKLEEGGKFAEAVEVAKEILGIRTRVQGKDHWQTLDAGREVATLTKVESLPAEERKEWLALPDVVQEAFQKVQKGRYAEAEPLLRKALEIHRRVQGEEHPDTAGSYNKLAVSLWYQGKYADAERLYRKALGISRRVLGNSHPETATSYNNLGMNLNGQGKYAEAQPLLREALDISRRVLGEDHRYTAASYNNVAINLDHQGKYAEAEPVHRSALLTFRLALGEEHPDTARSYQNAALNLNGQDKYREAEPLLRKALAIYRRQLGEDHPQTAFAYNALANTLDAQGRSTEAEPLSNYALAIRQRVLGEDHPDTTDSYAGVAYRLNAQGKYAEAEALFRKALAIRRRVLGEEHPRTAASYSGLASNLRSQEKYEQAEQLLRRALAIERRVLGEEHPHTATSYNDVAVTLDAQGKYAEAEPLFRRGLAIRRRVLGEEHWGTAGSYHNMGTNLHGQCRYAEAEPILRKSLGIWRRLLGDEHPVTALGYGNLAANLQAQGKYAEAEAAWSAAAACLERARQRFAFTGLNRTALIGERSPLSSLAAVLARNGKGAEAWRRLQENLGRGLFDDLSARQARRLSPEERKRQQELTAKLERLDKLFANLPPAKENSPERQKQLDDLKKQYGAAQAAYSEFEAEMARKYGAAAGDVYSIAKIQERLPADTALLAWLDLKGQPKAADPNGEHWSFVLRHRGEPICVKLPGSGPKGAWTKEDDEFPGRVAKSFAQRPDEAVEWRKSTAVVANQRLAPISKLLVGDGKQPPVKHVIVLPSSSMADVPVETLLTEKDEITVSYAPSGTIYTWLREKAKTPSPRPLPQGGEGVLSLLALADPAFAPQLAQKDPAPPDHGVFVRQAVPGSPAEKAGMRSGDVVLSYAGKKLAKLADLDATRKQLDKSDAKEIAIQVWRDGKTVDLKLPLGPMGVQVDQRSAAEVIRGEREFAKLMRATRGQSFQPLPGARREVEAISSTIKSKRNEAAMTELIGSDASEQRLDEMNAKGELAKYRFLHLATHGVADRRFHLKSYLVLAQDKLPDPVEQVLAGKPAYDGKLTAEQIMKTWTLNADLVVLSACESGLGKYGGGEG